MKNAIHKTLYLGMQYAVVDFIVEIRFGIIDLFALGLGPFALGQLEHQNKVVACSLFPSPSLHMAIHGHTAASATVGSGKEGEGVLN